MRAEFRRGEIDDITKPENKTARYNELEKKFDELVEAQRDILVKNEFDRIYTRDGGSGDERLHHRRHDRLLRHGAGEQAGALDVDGVRPALAPGLPRVLLRARRRLRGAADADRVDPAGQVPGGVQRRCSGNRTPYTWPVVGWPSDIPTSPRRRRTTTSPPTTPRTTHRRPRRRLRPEGRPKLAEEYFGRIPRGKTPPPEIMTLEPKWELTKSPRRARPRRTRSASIRWHTVPFQHKDSYAARPPRRDPQRPDRPALQGLVLPADGVATQRRAATIDSREVRRALRRRAPRPRKGRRPQELEQRHLRRDREAEKEPVPAEELQKVKNNFAANSYRRLSAQLPDPHPADDRTTATATGGRSTRGRRSSRRVTAADVQRVAKEYLDEGEPDRGALHPQGGRPPSRRIRRSRTSPSRPADDQGRAAAAHRGRATRTS